MIFTKEIKISKSINSYSLKNKFRKIPLYKKSIFTLMFILGALFISDTINTFSFVKNVSDNVDNRKNYYNNLSINGQLSKHVNNFNYSDEEFKKDLNLFKFIYIDNKNSPLYNGIQGRKYNPLQYNLSTLMLLKSYEKNYHIDPKKNFYDMEYSYVNNTNDINYNQKEISEQNIINYKRVKVFYSEMYAKQPLLVPLSSYEDIEKDIESKNFNYDVIFIKKEYSKALYTSMTDNKRYKEITDLIKKDNKKNMDKIIKLYEQGKIKELRVLFSSINAYEDILINNRPSLYDQLDKKGFILPYVLPKKIIYNYMNTIEDISEGMVNHYKKINEKDIEERIKYTHL